MNIRPVNLGLHVVSAVNALSGVWVTLVLVHGVSPLVPAGPFAIFGAL